MTPRTWGIFAALCLVWGIPYLLIKVAVAHLSPPVLVAGRTTIGALVLLPLAVGRGQLRLVTRAWPLVLAFAAVETACPWLLLSDAERHLTSSLAGLLIAAVPLVGTLIMRASGVRGHLGRTQWLGLVVGLAGVGAVVGFDLGRLRPVPLLEMAVVVVCYAAGPQLVARRLAHLPGMGLIFVALSASALVTLPVAVALRPARVPPAGVLLAVAGLGVLCTGLAFVLLLELIRQVGPVRATVITYVNPAVAVALGVWLRHEPITLGIGAGFALILLGSVLATRPAARRRGGVAAAPTPG